MNRSTTARIPTVEIIITEDVDLLAAGDLGARLDDALALHPDELVVDVASCPVMSAAAIGALVDAHRRLVRDGGVLTVRGPSARLQRLFHLAHVDRVLHTTPRSGSENSEVSDVSS